MPVIGDIDFKLVCSCFYLWIYIFAFVLFLVEITDLFMFLTLLVGPAFTYWFICTFSIPPPKESVVKEILGPEMIGELLASDPAVATAKSSAAKKSDDPTDFIMKAVAHRFAGIEAPENSLEALDLCYQNGAVAVEFDLVLTADLVPVIFHDRTMERITDIVEEITNMSWEEIKLLDISVKHPFHQKFAGTHIPLFEDVVKKCLEYDLRFFIDIKDDRQEVADTVLKMFEKYPKMYKRAVVSSFNGYIIYNIRRSNPAIVASMAWRPFYISLRTFSVIEQHRVPHSKNLPLFCAARLLDHMQTWLFNNVASDLIGFSAVLLCKDVITPETVMYWKSKNVRLFAWTINNPLEKMHFSRNLGVGYFTDSMLGND